MKFGERLRELRKQRNMSQYDLARLIDVDYTYISKIETGEMRPPSEVVIWRLAQALDADASELLNLSGKVPRRLHKSILNNPLLTELVRFLCEHPLPNEVYQQMIDLARRQDEQYEQ
jgi:HTH-type transcriptional regulator, competence development regulator